MTGDRRTTLRVATFNLLHGRELAGGGADPTVLAAALTELDADIVALQEVDRHQERSGGADQTAVAARALRARDWRFLASVHGVPAPVSGWWEDLPDDDERHVFGPAQLGSGGPSYGVALLSRLPVLRWRARRFPAAPVRLPLRVQGRPGLTRVPDERRAVLTAVVEGPTGPLTVVAAHLSFVPGWNVSQLARIRRSTGDLPSPQLLLGDFNLPSPVPQAVVWRRERIGGRGRSSDRDGFTGPDGGRVDLSTPGTATTGMLTGTVGRGGGPGRQDTQRTRWRSLARIATYPSYRPRVQFDHVLARGVAPTAVRSARAVRLAVSDHCALVVELDLAAGSDPGGAALR